MGPRSLAGRTAGDRARPREAPTSGPAARDESSSSLVDETTSERSRRPAPLGASVLGAIRAVQREPGSPRPLLESLQIEMIAAPGWGPCVPHAPGGMSGRPAPLPVPLRVGSTRSGVRSRVERGVLVQQTGVPLQDPPWKVYFLPQSKQTRFFCCDKSSFSWK